MDTNFIAILLSGKNPITASLVPSFAFVIVIWAIVSPYDYLPAGIDGWLEQGLALLITSAVISVFLQFFNTITSKFLEGYGFLSRFPYLKKRQMKQAKQLLEEREILANRIGEFKMKREKIAEEEITQLSKIFDEYYSVSVKYDQSFPPHLDTIMPTRFGNILRAAEAYPLTRYGIDSVPFWRLLIGIMPESYKENISRSRVELSFFVNCIILSLLSILLFLGIVLSQLFSSSIEIINLAGLLCSIVLIILFYQSSLSHALNFGEMVRGAYDLYRHDILRQLNIKVPKNSSEEFYLWKNLGEFVNLGAASFEFESIKYDLIKEKDKK